MKTLRFFPLLFCLINAAVAEDIYIAATALGTGSGTSAANALAYTFFNSSANWDQLANTTNGKIGPGDTVHIVGIINFTGTTVTSTNQLVFQGGGTPGNPITLKFEVGGRLRHPTGLPTGLITAVGSSIHDIIIQGANSTVQMNTGSVVQIDVEVFANGTALANQVDGNRLLYIDGAGANVTLTGMYFWGAYVRTYNHGTDFHASANIVTFRGTNNLTIDNCRADYGEGGFGMTGIGALNQNLRITNSVVYGCSTAIKMGATGTNKNDGVVITGNVLDGFGYWSGLQAPDQHHCDGIQTITAGAGQRQRTITVAYNRVGPDLGEYGAFNAHIYLEDDIMGVLCYNNLVYTYPIPVNDDPNPARNGRRPGTANGFITITPNGAAMASADRAMNYIYNNTVLQAGSGMGIAVGWSRVFGNVVVDSSSYIALQDRTTAPDSILGTTFLSDRNVFWDISHAGVYQIGVTGEGQGIYNINNWRSLLGYDLNTVVANPLVTMPTGTLGSGTPVFTGFGTLSSGSPAIGLAPTQAEFSDDLTRATRSVPWDAGALEFVTGGPVPPSVVSSAINAAGTQFSLTLSQNAAFGSGGNGGMVVASTAGAVTLGTPSIAGAVITWPITNRLIGQGETLTRAYTQPGNGIESSSSLIDLSSFPAVAVTNSSTVAQVATPQFAPVPGAYSSTQNVAITSTLGATIRYTTDGTTPTSSTGTIYTAPIPTSLSTTYTARAFLSGSLDSPIATGAYSIGDFVIGNIWTNIGVANQTGTFTWTFRATSSTSPNDCVLGLTNHTAVNYPDLGVIARFAASGNIDAWSGQATDYAAVNVFPYVAGQAYDFVVTVNVPAHTYSMTVVQAGGSTPTTIATNYGFRASQATIPNINNFGALATAGSVTVSNMIFTGAAPTLSLTGIATNTAGTQITATFNSQPSFGLGGQGGFTVSASAGATTPSAPTVGANSITWNLSRTIGRGETVSATYAQPGNGIEAASGGADLASFAGQSAVNNSTVDTTAPIPNPSTFGISPTALTSSTITMTATTSTDANSPPVQYFFNEVSGNAGGSDSVWQSSATFTDAGLAAGTQYRYRVQVRDSAVPPNVTTFSQEFSATTKSVAGAHPAMPFNMARANIVTP